MDRETDLSSQSRTTRALDDTIAARVEAIVHAAEREADAARRDIAEHRRAAEAEARRYVAAAQRRADEDALHRTQRLADLSAEASREADDVRRRLEHLGAAVEQLARALRGEDAPGPAEPAPWADERPQAPPSGELPPELRGAVSAAPLDPPPPPAAEPVPAPVPGPAPAAPREPVAPDTARLTAIEMAVGGASRGEVERHLERETGSPPPPSLLDGVFGPDRDSATRLTWGRP